MLVYNLRLAWKSIRRHPVLTGLIVLGIALGVAVSTTFLTVHHALAQDPIPGKSDELFYVRVDSWSADEAFSDDGAPPPLVTWQDAQRLMQSDIPTRQTAGFAASLYVFPEKKGEQPLREDVRMTTSDFFPMFDVPFLYGSGWSRQAEARGEQVVVLGAELNGRLFGGVNSVGRKVRIGDRDFHVVGVLDEWRPNVRHYDMTGNPFAAPEAVFLPLSLTAPMQVGTAGNFMTWREIPEDFHEALTSSEAVFLQMWVELDTPAQQEAYRGFLDAYVREQKRLGRFPRPLNNRITAVVELMEEWEVVPPQARSLVLISFLFLVVAALNLVGLFLGKFLARASTVGVRRALGATRWAIFQQHLVECELIGLIGGALGLLLSVGSLALVNRYYQPAGEGFFRLDAPMMAAAVALSLFAGALAGLYPAWRICSLPPALHLKNQ